MTSLRTILSVVDVQCLAAAGLFLFSNILDCIIYLSFRNTSNFNYHKMVELDPFAIIEQWEYRSRISGLMCFTGVITSCAWFMLIIPMVKIAWIQSSQGSYRIGLHAMIVCLILGGSFTEIIAELLYIGSQTGISWMAKGFELTNWSVRDDLNHSANDMEDKQHPNIANVDMIGWKTLEVINNAMNGLMLWIDSAEWVFLSITFLLIFISVRGTSSTTATEERYRQHREKQFNLKWSLFGLFISILCMFNFITDIIRFRAWYIFGTIAFFISVVNRLVLIPVWLVWLSIQLPSIEQSYEYSCLAFENQVLSYKAPTNTQQQQQEDDNIYGQSSSLALSSGHHADIGDDTDDIIDPRYA